MPPGFSTRSHSHPAEGIALILRGGGRVTIDGVDHPAPIGTVIVTPANLVHVSHADPGKPTVTIWLHAPPASEARWVEPEGHETPGHAG